MKTAYWLTSTMVGAAICATVPAAAQAQADDEFEQLRIGIGPEFKPAYPGADGMRLGPFFDIDRRAEGEDFAFEAPTESFGIALLETSGVYVGPVVAFTNKRGEDDTTPGLRTIGTTIEPGIGVQAQMGEQFYAFTEVRRGIGGHDGWTGQAGVDFIMRDGDNYTLSAGPRLTWGDSKHSQAYFGVTEAESLASGITAYDADGGLQSAGGAVSIDFGLTGPWGISAYGGYHRLVGDAADSPLVELFGSKDQWSGGVAITYTFRRKRGGLF